MTLDTRTDAERRYDETRLSRTPADQGPFGVDPNIDEMIATFERLEAAGTEEILRLASAPKQPVIRITADGTPNKYDTGEWKMEWLDVRTPIATLPDGSIISGTHNVDGAPWCTHLESEDGQFYCGPDGVMAGDWDDVSFEDLTLEQALKLRDLFTSGRLQTLIDAAKAWCKPA
jgi:hypothetical protein